MFTKLYKLLFVIALITMIILPVSGQQSQFQKKSAKPASFETALPGISSFNFVGGNGDVDFIEAYFIEEIKKWMNAVRPGIRFGIDYSKPSPEHVNINYDFSCRQQLANNGVWWWVVSNAKVIFEIEGLEYKYEYSIPNFSVQGNNFSNHVLYNSLLKSVAGHSYTYNKAYSLHLAKYQSHYNEANLKASWRNEGCKLFEGIYENVSSDNGGKSNKYKLAMKYVNDKPYLIYLDGANLFDDWKEGEVKAWLEPTATPNIFKAQWLMAFKTVSTAYVAFQNGAMQISVSESNENDSYIKLFPSTTDDVAIEGAKPNEWTGTGFALKNNFIVTNYHVIDGAKSISIRGINGNFTKGYSADVVATDKNIDLAILKVNGITIPSANIPYSVKTTNAEVGEEVFVLGYPMTSTMGEEIKLTTGVVSSRSGFQGDVSLYQTTAPIQPGNSGGPLFDSKGNIIGIVSAKHRGAENVGYAIKASYLRNLLESSISSNILPQSNKIAGQNLSGKVKSAKNYVYYIKCSSKVTNNIGTNQSLPIKETENTPTLSQNKENAEEYTKSAYKHYQNGEYAKAVVLLQKAISLEYAEAQYMLGFMYQYGQGVEKNYLKAIELYKKAAEQNYIDAFCKIGYMYEKGIGVKQNYNKALENYQIAANQKDGNALWHLGDMYYWGHGVSKNYRLSEDYFIQSAKVGYVAGMNTLGWHYYKGDGFSIDFSKAEEWFKKAIKADPSWASPYSNMALLYAKRDKNFTEALRYSDMAIEKANAEDDEDKATVYGERGLIYYWKGDMVNAREMLKKCIKLNPNYLKGDDEFAMIMRSHNK